MRSRPERVALVLVLFASACGAGNARPAPPPPPFVTVHTVGRQDIALVTEAVGSAAGFIDAELRARVRGFLESQRYKDGSHVKEGQILFTIQSHEYQAALA